MDNIVKNYIFLCYKEMEFSRVYSLMVVVIGFILVFFIIYMVYIYIWVLGKCKKNISLYLGWKFVI